MGALAVQIRRVSRCSLMRRGYVLTAAFLALAACSTSTPRGGAGDPHSRWEVIEVVSRQDERAVLRFANGRVFTTTLYDVQYLGQIPSSTGAPYLVLSGRGCTDCDANRSLYFHSPDDGPMQEEADQPRYAYPGTIIEWEPEIPSDTIASRSRVFLGDCLPSVGAKAVWFTEERTGPAELTPRVLLLLADEHRLEEAEMALPISDAGPIFTGLDEVLENVRRGRCTELRGIEQLREP